MRDARVAGDSWFYHLRVDGGLDFSGTRFLGPVNLQRAVVEGDLRLHGGGYAGGLRLDGARIAGDLNIAEATAHAPPDGAAIRASGATVGGGVWAHQLVAEGTVDLIGVRAVGAIALERSTLRCPDGIALLLISAQTAMLTVRPAPASAGAVVLRDAHVGRLIDDPVGWPQECPIELAGLTYERMTRRSDTPSEWTARQRLDWMARYSTGFAPGPYDQLAAALRRDGREPEAREVLRVRERLRHRAMGRLGAIWGTVQDVAIGFGYQPRRWNGSSADPTAQRIGEPDAGTREDARTGKGGRRLRLSTMRASTWCFTAVGPLRRALCRSRPGCRTVSASNPRASTPSFGPGPSRHATCSSPQWTLTEELS